MFFAVTNTNTCNSHVIVKYMTTLEFQSPLKCNCVAGNSPYLKDILPDHRHFALIIYYRTVPLRLRLRLTDDNDSEFQGA